VPRDREEYKLLPRKTQDGRTVWYVRYYDRAGHRVKKSTGKEKRGEAREVARQILQSGPGSSMRLAEFAKDFFLWGACTWIRRQHAKGRDFGEYQARQRRGHLDRHILPAFGARRLSEITGPAIERWLLTLELQNQTRNHILYTFRIVLREATREGLIRHNPLQEPERFKPDALARDVLTLAELGMLFPKGEQQLLEIWRHEKYAVLFLVLASTGIRSGEARALHWHDVHTGGWLTILQAARPRGEIGPVSSRKGGERIAAAPRRTMAMLARWRRHTPCKDPDDLVFFGTNAQIPLNVETVTHMFTRALTRAGIARGDRNLVAHSLRHGYNTMMRPRLPREILMSLTGHHTKEMVANYDHATLEDRMRELGFVRPLIEQAWQ
jgi:integrase